MPNNDCPLCYRIEGQRTVPPDVKRVWRFPNSFAFLGPWQYYHGYCVLISRKCVPELSRLADGERRGYLEEMCVLARALEECFQPCKLNYELLGNQVPHLHWHLFPRYENDPEKLKPVWLAIERTEHDPQERTRLKNGPLTYVETLSTIRTHLKKTLGREA